MTIDSDWIIDVAVNNIVLIWLQIFLAGCLCKLGIAATIKCRDKENWLRKHDGAVAQLEYSGIKWDINSFLNDFDQLDV